MKSRPFILLHFCLMAFVLASCKEDSPSICDIDSESRDCYISSEVPFDGECLSSVQTRTCNDGIWDPDWDVCNHLTCVIGCESEDSTNIVHGADEIRRCYHSASVAHGNSCTYDDQTRTCDNGTWGAWSDDCDVFSCVSTCDGLSESIQHGGTETRDCYDASEVPFDGECLLQEQTRTCNDGNWDPDWDTCTHLTCVKGCESQDSTNIAHGTDESRRCYHSASVAYGNSCTYDDQTRTCDNGTWGAWSDDCDVFSCSVLPMCVLGQFNCNGNQVQECDPTPPAHWIPKQGQPACLPTANQKCDPTDGTCKTLTPNPATLSGVPTGVYYTFAEFALSGYDVDSYGDKIYVNRSSQYLDVYTVILIDDNGIPGLQPNMHPDLPSSDPNYGPMETRQLSLLATYSQSTHGVPLGNGHTAELYADVDRVFMINPDSFGAGLGGYGTIASWTFANTYTQPISVAHPTNAPSGIETLAYDGLWYCANRARSVFSYHVPTNEWVAEFQFPSLSGGHSDGMEAVTDPNTGIKYLYVSDMTSGMLAQYRRAGTSWVMENVFSNENDADYVEGLGFGAFNHFWITSGSTLYEIGGGDLTQFLE